ncbi:MAG: class I SAM-dependent methyltransferase [Acidobacteria bacterium]|nr:class I SAM-dependent methyltransferase [Acidobacteriota bacterium]
MEHLLRATALAERRHFWFRGFRRFVTPLVAQALAGCTAPRILDCGCGTGANLELLGRFGHACGFDLSPAGLGLARREGRLRTVRASVAAVPFPSGRFDLVTSFDVLYALPPAVEQAAVAEMYRLIRPGGYALVNVAAMPLLRGDHSMLSRELRRYSRATLRALLGGAGFRIERLTHTNATLFAPLLAARLLQRLRGLPPEARAQTDIAMPPAPVNAALSALLACESLWLRRFDAPLGSSLLCLARKPS